jgi:probable FeS assembly SUF system protein SufT
MNETRLTRTVKAVQIPSGGTVPLPAGTPVTVTQALGGAFTVHAPTLGGLFRVEGADADALGLPTPAPEPALAPGTDAGAVTEERVTEELRTCFDPEIPVNVIDLGLVYDVRIEEHPGGGARVAVQMTLTAPGCGMGQAIAQDARAKIARIPGVREASVRIVWEPAWNPGMMSPEGKRKLGLP